MTNHPADKITIRTSVITTASRPWILAGLVGGASAVAPDEALVGVPGHERASVLITTCTWET